MWLSTGITWGDQIGCHSQRLWFKLGWALEGRLRDLSGDSNVQQFLNYLAHFWVLLMQNSANLPAALIDLECLLKCISCSRISKWMHGEPQTPQVVFMARQVWRTCLSPSKYSLSYYIMAMSEFSHNLLSLSLSKETYFVGTQCHMNN